MLSGPIISLFLTFALACCRSLLSRFRAGRAFLRQVRYLRRVARLVAARLWRGALTLWHFESPASFEFASACWLILWGVIIAAPGQAFDMSHGYDKMRMLPEWVWGSLALGIGGGQLLAVLHGCVCNRRWAARLAVSFYVALTMMFTFGRWPLSAAFYGLHAAFAMWVQWRLAGRRCEK